MQRDTRPSIDFPTERRRATAGGADQLLRFASLALAHQQEEEAIPLLRAGVGRFSRDARLWQMLGLTFRALGELGEAVEALDRARRLAPGDARIAHGLARSRLEAGLEAVDDFVDARRLQPSDGAAIQGHAAALFAAGRGDLAIAEIDGIVRQQPLWLDGHATLARLRRLLGDPDDLRSYREALSRHPREPGLWQALFSTLVVAERFADLHGAIAAARAGAVALHGLDLMAAIADDETGETKRAGEYFDQLPAEADTSAQLWRVRSLLRRQRAEAAADIAHRVAQRGDGGALWPYVALAWRALGDPRWAWLEGDASFVRVVDLSQQIDDRSGLAARLRSLHLARERPLDQSVRGGTQTDGPLLSRIDPEIVALRQVIQAAVQDYVAALPPPDPGHPLLSAGRSKIRFAGSWSVRLTDAGHHADHVHSQGWISSALYVSLPGRMGEVRDDPDREGWLRLGSLLSVLPDFAPFREIAPKPGRLVLFPSTMWHGTRPFTSGERLTVAFDVARTN